MSSYVCFSRHLKPCEFIKASEIQGKTPSSLKSRLKLEKETLCVVTPYFAQPCDPKKPILSEFPNLELPMQGNPFPPAPNHIRIIPENEPPFSLFVQTQTHLDEDFPLMEIRLTSDELNKTNSSQFLERCVQVFSLKITKPQLFRNGVLVGANVPTLDLFRSSQTNHLLFKCVLDESEHEQVVTRRKLADEVVSSEEVYVKSLQRLHYYWRPAYRDSKIFDAVQMRFIFGDVERLLNVHEDLLKELRSVRIEGNSPYSAMLGPIFLKYVDRFKVSTSFISNYKNATELVGKKAKQSKTNEMKLQEVDEMNPDCNDQNFYAYYITPVQRYPRYRLLVRDLAKKSAPFHPDREYLEKALETIDNTNRNLDQTSHHVKQLLLMEQIQKELPDTFFLMEPGRELILTENVRLSKPKSTSAILYLFNDIVLLCTSKGKKLNIHLSASLSEFRFCSGRPNASSIMTLVDGKEYVIVFDDYDKKTIWMDRFVTNRTAMLLNIGFENKFVKWTEVEIGATLYPLMNHDGICQDGKVIFIGGINQSMTYTSTMLTYDVKDAQWQVSLAGIEARAYHTVNIIDSIIYVAFGQTKSSICKTVSKCRFGTNNWEELTLNQKDVERCGHSCVVHNGRLVIYGGRNDKEVKGDVLIVNPIDNITMVLDPCSMMGAPPPRVFHAAVLFNDSMIVVGGKSEGSIVGDIFIFNIKERNWTPVPLKIQGRMYHKLMLHNKYLFVIGGTDTQKVFGVEVINTETWQPVKLDQFGNEPFGISRFGFADIGDGRGMVFGGMDSVAKTPFSCSWIMDVADGFNEDREPTPRQRTPETRTVVNLELDPIPKMPSPDRSRSQSARGSPNKQIEPMARKAVTTNLPPKASRESDRCPQVSGFVDFASIQAVRTRLRKYSADGAGPGPLVPEQLRAPPAVVVGVPKPPAESKDVERRKTTNPSDLSPLVLEKTPVRRASLSPRATASPRDAGVQEFYRAHNIDVTKLNPIEQSSTRMRVTRLLQKIQQNDDNEAKVAKMEAMLSGNPTPDTVIVVKIVDNRVMRLVKITASMSCADVKAKIEEKVGDGIKNLSIEVTKGKLVALTDQSLKEAEVAAFKSRFPGVIVHLM